MAISAMVFIIVGTIFYQNKFILIFAVAGVVALLGSWRFISDFRQNDIAQYYGQKLLVSGIISTEPDIRSDKIFLTLSSVAIEGKKLESKILLTVGRFPEYEYGESMEFEGKIGEPKEYEDFSYKNYLSRYGIDAVVYNPKIAKSEKGQGNKIKLAILKIKEKFTDGIAENMPEPQNAFLNGLLLGAKKSIPEDLVEKFNITGTSHIIAISGFNITIIAYGLDLLLQRFRKRISFALSLVSIVVFVIATGASASVVRAGIMGILLLIALNIGRIYAIANALAVTAVLMLLINPQILLFDVGFQLSFLALLGLVYMTPFLRQYDLRLPKSLQTALYATIAAQVFTLPILLINFGRLSIVAPIANVLVFGAVPLTMLFGFLAGLAALIYPLIATPFIWITWLILTYIIKVVEALASLPFSSISWEPNWWFGIFYYLLLAIILWKLKQKKSLPI